MKRKRLIKKIILFLSIIIVFILGIQAPWQLLIEGPQLRMSVNLKVDHTDIVQLFYTPDKSEQFSEKNSISQTVKASPDFQIVNFIIPIKNIDGFRLDPGTMPGKYSIKNISLRVFKNTHMWDAYTISKSFVPSKGIGNMQVLDSSLNFNVNDNDPFFYSNDISFVSNQLKPGSSTYTYVYVSIVLIVLCLIFIFLSFYKRIWLFIRDIIQSRSLIVRLAKKDLQKRYIGSYLGIIWAFIQPLITIFIFWFVFQIGFKSAPIQDFPFILWLMCGMIPWFYFSESLQSATSSIIDNSYLVKKVVFRVDILPIIRILSSLIVHLFFIFIIFIMFFIYGYKPNIYNIQVIYYMLCSTMLVLSMCWVTSTLVVFLKDLRQIVAIIIQFGFWMTPIFWSSKIMPEKYQFLFKLNPVYYIVEGYRDSFINHVWLWQHYNLTVNFWVITCSFFIVGVMLFKRLRPHFADVL